ncbi:MAG: SDR family NAD(P)-dependent oxidoreductase [Elusimicrobiales bacterium]
MEPIGIWGAAPGRGDGIGKSILEKLVKEHNAVHVFGRSKDKIHALRKTFDTVKGSHVWDLRDESRAESYQKYLSENNIRTVISTVGAGVGNPIPFLSQGELTEMVEANLVSPFMILKHSLLPLKQLNGGRVIIFGSITSIKAEEGASGYTATKMAIRGMIEAARRELKSGFQMVSVHGVYTGSMRKVGIASVLEAITCLTHIPYGVHTDIIID